MQSFYWEESDFVELKTYQFFQKIQLMHFNAEKKAYIFATVFISIFHLKIAQIIWWLYCGSIKSMHWIYRCYSTSLAMLCHIYCNSCNFRCIKRSLAQTPIPHLHLKCVCLFLFHWILSLYPWNNRTENILILLQCYNIECSSSRAATPNKHIQRKRDEL